jgi:transcription elongation factor GreA
MLVSRDAAPSAASRVHRPSKERIMSTVAHQPEQITRAGYERLQTELEHLVTIKRPQIAEELREARDDGTEPGETRPVAEALDDQATLERRIDELEAALAAARIADPPADGVAGIGQRVSIRLAAGRSPIDYDLVGAIEADPPAGRISVSSPIGAALVGRVAGDRVTVVTPGGVRTIEIVAVGRP